MMLTAARPARIAGTAVSGISRSFSSTPRKLDLAKVTLLGRLGNDPVLRTTSSGKPYYSYNVATSTGPPKEEDGRSVPSTSWHTVFAFNEASHPGLSRVGKGSSVYVEADLEMRSAHSSDGQTLHDRALLRHLSMRVISRNKPASEEGEVVEE